MSLNYLPLHADFDLLADSGTSQVRADAMAAIVGGSVPVAEDSSGGLSRLGVVLFAGMAAFFATRTANVESGRPTAKVPATHIADQAASSAARMWQDPFDVLSKGDFSEADRAASCDAYMAAGGQRLFVMVSGLGQEGSAETRRRRRSAVVAALDAEQYAPVDGQIFVAATACLPHEQQAATPQGVPSPKPVTLAPSAPRHANRPHRLTPTHGMAAGTVMSAPAPLEMAAPSAVEEAEPQPCADAGVMSCFVYERFVYAPPPTLYGPVAAHRNVTLVWLPEEALGTHVAARLAALQAAGNAPLPNLILGPSQSDTLRRLVTNEDGPDGGEDKPFDPPLIDFAATAQVEPSPPYRHAVCRLGGNTDFCAKSADALRIAKSADVLRIGPSDDELADALAQELRRRIDSTADSVAILSEWNTGYGRGLGARLASEVSANGGPDVIRIDFSSGLDGTSSDGTRSPNAPAAAEQEAQAGTSSEKTPDKTKQVQDKAEGDRQIDYVLRVVADLRNRARDHNLRAIGIVGSDVYDKRLLLRALRPHFPGALFFTTDLDARLLEHAVIDDTRGLLIATAFTLSPPAQMQGPSLPFRDTYGTAAFLATRYALRCPIPSLRCKGGGIADVSGAMPHLVEITRQGDTADLTCAANSAPDACTQPPEKPLYVANVFRRAFWGNLLAALVGLGALLVVTPTIERRWALSGVRPGAVPPAKAVPGQGIRKLPAAVSVVLVLAMLVLWPSIRGVLTEWGDGEPMDVFRSNSLWPAIWMRVAIGCVALWLAVRVVRRLNNSLVDISNDYGLPSASTLKWPRDARGIAARLWFYLKLRPSPPDETGFKIAGYWENTHLPRCEAWARYARSAWGASMLFAVLCLVGWIYGYSTLPVRGGIVGAAYWVSLGWSIGMLLFLASLVGDATLNSTWLIDDVGVAYSAWPEAVCDKYANGFGWYDEELVSSCIDLKFFSERTKAILPLIYAPFAILALLILCQLLGMELVFPCVAEIAGEIVVFAMLAGSVLLLRIYAEDERGTVVGKLQMAASRVAGWNLRQANVTPAEGVPTPEQLDRRIADVTAMRDGAFADVLQQPIVKAVILPIGASAAPFLTQLLTG